MMTPKEALEYLSEEFIRRFDCRAEGCASAVKTHEAMLVLTDLAGLPPMECASPYCKFKDENLDDGSSGM